MRKVKAVFQWPDPSFSPPPPPPPPRPDSRRCLFFTPLRCGHETGLCVFVLDVCRLCVIRDSFRSQFMGCVDSELMSPGTL